MTPAPISADAMLAHLERAETGFVDGRRRPVDVAAAAQPRCDRRDEGGGGGEGRTPGAVRSSNAGAISFGKKLRPVR